MSRESPFQHHKNLQNQNQSKAATREENRQAIINSKLDRKSIAGAQTQSLHQQRPLTSDSHHNPTGRHLSKFKTYNEI
jgi:hypothetical protein